MNLAWCIWFSLVTRLTGTWVSSSKSRTCASGLTLSPINIPITLLAKRKWLCGVSSDEMASLGHTFLRTRMWIWWQWKFIPALRRKRGVDLNTVIYQQDGAPPHCSDRSLEFLGRYFPGLRTPCTACLKKILFHCMHSVSSLCIGWRL